jgi:hypothetical protein
LKHIPTFAKHDAYPSQISFCIYFCSINSSNQYSNYSSICFSKSTSMSPMSLKDSIANHSQSKHGSFGLFLEINTNYLKYWVWCWQMDSTLLEPKQWKRFFWLQFDCMQYLKFDKLGSAQHHQVGPCSLSTISMKLHTIL